jgi:hypothetical protein
MALRRDTSLVENVNPFHLFERTTRIVNATRHKACAVRTRLAVRGRNAVGSQFVCGMIEC